GAHGSSSRPPSEGVAATRIRAPVQTERSEADLDALRYLSRRGPHRVDRPQRPLQHGLLRRGVRHKATDAWLDQIGLSVSDRHRSGVTTFTLESHVCYLRELHEGAPLRFTTRLLGFDEKRIHYFHEMLHAEEGWLAATNEL